MEELIYYGILILFYLYSSYRSSQKRKQSRLESLKSTEVGFENRESKPQEPFFDLGINLEERSDPLAIFKEALEKEKAIQESRKKVEIILDREIQNEKKEPTFYENHPRLSNIKRKPKKTKSNKLLAIQRQYRNQPFKLAIVMKTILDEPLGLQNK